MQKTAAWPLALSYIGLIVYASLYPFSDWRDQGLNPWSFLIAPWPRYWTGFDVGSNIVGYMPAGFFLALTAARTGRGRHTVSRATLVCGVLSICMETLQIYLPARVPSNVDLGLNLLGGFLGASLAWLLERWGAIDRWSRVRARWFVPEARGALVLMALWPPALLFPAALPLGLGQVMERLEAALVEALDGTPFLVWLPVREIELQPLLPVSEILCVALGALIPCLIAYCVVRPVMRRVVVATGIVAVGIAMTSLSATLTWGPQHAWDWLQLPVRAGLLFGWVLALLLAAVAHRAGAALALLAMGVYLSLLNQSPADPYFMQTLQTWEQGRFIRFHGLAQWLGWLWPYAAVVYLVQHLWLGGREN
ncbi:MAG: VanZ family protein [Rhodoferax sp.]|jgi:VanZ family protein|nr:VanZ family protein [Rhodoferax sp.]